MYFSYDRNTQPNVLDVLLIKALFCSLIQEPITELDSGHIPVKITINGHYQKYISH